MMADFATTLDFPEREEWVSRGMCLTTDGPGPVVLFARIVRAARSGMLLVLNGFSVVDRLASAVLARRRGGPTIILTDCNWKRGVNPLDRLWTAAGIRSLRGRNVVFCVDSTETVDIFARIWSVDPSRIRVLHWYHGLTEEQLAQKPTHDGPIFSGGRSLRDYRALLSCAPSLSKGVLIAASRSALPADVPIPPNVRVVTLPHDGFISAMRDASVVVVPLVGAADRSAGETTYLDAMAMGKLTVVTDSVGVRDYVEDGRTVLLVPPGDPAALRSAIEWALDPANAMAVNKIRLNAQQRARSDFGQVSHVCQILEIIDGELEHGHP